MKIIDAHAHLWKPQHGRVNGRAVRPLENGRSDFGGEVRQMMPPYMLNCENTAEMLLANMDYAGVSGAVITQEEIDGNQDAYLCSVRQQHPDRFRVCSLYEEGQAYTLDGVDGIKLCGGRLSEQDLTKHAGVFAAAAHAGKFVSIDMADGDRQTASLLEMIRQFPTLRIAIGHFGMVTTPNWQAQIRLARHKNVFVESGGITWLFHKEFYPYPGALRAIREAAEICGIEKLMWGSDYPRTMVEITYKMSFDFILKSSEFTKDEKHLFLCGNAQKFYGFQTLPQPQIIKNMLED